MGKIPSYDRQNRLTTEAPNVQVSPSVYGMTGDALAQAGSSLYKVSTDMYQKLDEAKDYTETLDAKVTTKKAMAQLKQKAVEDINNVGDMSKYEAEITKTKDAVLKKISKQSLKDKMALDYELDAQDALIDIQTQFRKNGIDKGRALNLEDIKMYQESYAVDGNPEHIEKITKSIEMARIKGFWNDEDAWKLKDKSIKDAKNKAFSADLANNNPYIQERLDSNYYDFDVKELVEAKKDWNVKKEKDAKEREQLTKDIQNNNMKEAVLRLFNGNLTRIDALNMYNEGKLSDGDYNTLERKLTDPMLEIKNSDVVSYNDLVLMKAERKKNQEEINHLIYTMVADRKLSFLDAQELLDTSISQYTKRDDDLIALNVKNLRESGEQIFNGDKQKSEGMIYDFIKRIENEGLKGDLITEAASNILKDRLFKENPSITEAEIIDSVREKFGIKPTDVKDTQLPKKETVNSPFPEYPDAYIDNGIWKVTRDGKTYRIEE